MPWVAASGRVYELALLDTNALSEVVKYPDREGTGFLELLALRPIAPCFTPYNLFELYFAPAVFEGFLDFFSQIPIFVTLPWEMVLTQELDRFDHGTEVSPLLNAFTPGGPDPAFDLRSVVESVLADPETESVIASGDPLAVAMNVLDTWLSNKGNLEVKSSVANAEDARRYVTESGLQVLGRLHGTWVQEKLERGVVPNAHDFPALATMLYSQYWRLWDASWTRAPGEVNDIQIMAIAPYMDIVVTETRQAEVFRKIQKKVSGLDQLKVLQLSDLRRSQF